MRIVSKLWLSGFELLDLLNFFGPSHTNIRGPPVTYVFWEDGTNYNYVKQMQN